MTTTRKLLLQYIGSVAADGSMSCIAESVVDKALTELVRENDRLRNALIRIADGTGFGGPEHSAYYEMREYAREVVGES